MPGWTRWSRFDTSDNGTKVLGGDGDLPPPWADGSGYWSAHSRETPGVNRTTFALIASLTALASGCARQSESSLIRGPYLGQRPPGETPEVFAPGIISSAGFHLHSSLAFSLDGKEVYFTKYVAEPEVKGTIWRMRQEGDVWADADIASFSGVYSDDSPVFSPDGMRLYFASTRPVDERDDSDDLNIWYVERRGYGWGEPVYAGNILNSPYADFRLSFTMDGTIYLSSDRDDQDAKTFDVFTSRRVAGEYAIPEPVGDAINTPVTEQIAYVAPDESHIVFYRHNREKTDETGLYISFRDEDGSWSVGATMGDAFNSPPEAVTQAASLSPDGKYLFFLRRRHEAIYWVDASVIEDLKPNAREGIR